jgi:two-component sensor histidine kinase
VVVLDGVDLGMVLPVEVLPGPDQGPHLVETRRLAPCFSSVADARDFSRQVADRWQLRLIAEDLACVVSELVANALDHGLGLDADGGPMDGAAAPSRAGSPIELQLVRTADRVLCLVSDPATRPPRRLTPDAVRESGRGLQLIDSLSLDWGWAPLARASGSGKVVWAALAAPAPGTVARTAG